MALHLHLAYKNEFEKFECGKVTVVRREIRLNPSENLSSLREL
jgi:hypothetical protein